MVRWPGHVKPGTRSDLASSIDLAPTILAATGITPKSKLPGLDLVALASRKPDAPVTRSAVYGEIFAHDVADINRPSASLRFRWVRSGPLKLIAPAGSAKPQLFDLRTDPHEKTDLADKAPRRVSRLKSLLDTWWRPRPSPTEPSGP